MSVSNIIIKTLILSVLVELSCSKAVERPKLGFNEKNLDNRFHVLINQFIFINSPKENPSDVEDFARYNFMQNEKEEPDQRKCIKQNRENNLRLDQNEPESDSNETPNIEFDDLQDYRAEFGPDSGFDPKSDLESDYYSSDMFDDEPDMRLDYQANNGRNRQSEEQNHGLDKEQDLDQDLEAVE